MPTERFYRLPEEKRQVIREAAIKEFARVPFEKASINQIIQNADISRGSFYTYFADKQDVVAFIFEDSGTQMRKRCQELLEDDRGNLFDMMEGLFEYFVEKLQMTKNMLDIARNIFSYQENANLMGFDSMPELTLSHDENDPVYELYNMVDRSGWRIKDRDDFGPLMTICIAALMMALAQFYKCPDQLDRIRIMYKKKLDILRYGVLERNGYEN